MKAQALDPLCDVEKSPNPLVQASGWTKNVLLLAKPSWTVVLPVLLEPATPFDFLIFFLKANDSIIINV